MRNWSRRIAAALSLTVLCLQGTALAAAPPTLTTGARGSDVALMQRLLTYRGNPVAITELLGPTTAGLVRNFQARQGLQADGVVGPATWHALQPVLRKGDSGLAVTALQVELNAKRGADLPVTGYFGDMTRTAVITFQQHMGLTADGIVGNATWDALTGHFEEVPVSGTGFYRCADAESTWGTSNVVANIENVAAQWAAEGQPVRLGINDMSLPDGGYFPPHESHRLGLDVDFRLLRNDGIEMPVEAYWDPAYSRRLTQHLVDLLWATGEVEFILFNDPNVSGVKPWSGHDNHLHVHFRR